MSSPVSPPPVSGFPTPNRLYMRAKSLADDIARLKADVETSFPGLSPSFTPTTVAVFTWFAVGRYKKRIDLLDTFQAVLGNDASGRSFVVRGL